jgi:membrane-bound lytic murein transglycosylase A
MMKKTFPLICLSLGVAIFNPLCSTVAQMLPTVLPLTQIDPRTDCISQNPCSLGWDDQIWGSKGDRLALLTAIDHSLHYLEQDEAVTAYQSYPIKDITLDRVRRSLLRFRELVVSSQSPAQLQADVLREFDFYQSVGNNGRGNVKFTAYYEPVYTASPIRTAIYKYPLYRLPPNFHQWPKPQPKRIDLEGRDGLLGDKSPLHGLEIAWFRDRLDPFMIQIEGSAELKLTDGRTLSVGYAGGTDYPWTSISKELEKDGKLSARELSLPNVMRFFHKHPWELNDYLPRWERFVFFKETEAGATGSIHEPVTPERSIATDKSLMPPGALALIYSSLPYLTKSGKLEYHTVNRYVLDQDTGSAIKGPGRVDYFMGSGRLAGKRANVTGGDGSLFYLLLKE